MVNSPPPPGPESPLQREWRALATTALVVLLTPIWLVYKGYEKCQEWRQDRAYASQEDVLKQPPVAVMDEIRAAPTLPRSWQNSVFVPRQPSQENKGWDLLVLAPSKGDQWITCRIKNNESISDDNISCFNNGLLLVGGT